MMKRAIVKIKKLVSCLLAAAMLAGLLPALPAKAAGETYTLGDGFIEVAVSGDNGGFSIRTVEGDKLIKSDNNKDLLHRFGQFDTSFTSFEVTYANRAGADRVKEYLFGGNYSFLGLGGNNIETTRDAAGIESKWTVAGLTFTQRIELVNQAAAEHGMVFISYQVANGSGEPVSVKARVLLDTAMGSQDYAVYEVADRFGVYRTIEKERVITAADYIPANFFAYDDNKAPSVTAYTVNNSGSMPYQIAFGHWNSLASALFDFTPDGALTFTNQYNDKYLTADSAVAYYYEMGTNIAPKTESGIISTYYGVYSNRQAAAADSVAVNLTAPIEMALAADKKTYEPSEPGLMQGVFSVQTQINNFVSGAAKDIAEVTVAAYASNGITPLDEKGNPLPEEPTYLRPYTAQYFDFKVGATQTRRFYFKADVGAETAYRKVEIRVFDTSADKNLTQQNIIGSRYFYILCPGGDGKLPEVIFTGASPQIIYTEGTRLLHLTGRNFNLLRSDGAYNLRAYSKTDPSLFFDIPYEQITFPPDQNGANIMDVAVTEPMPTGTYELVFDWTGVPPAGIDRRMTAPALNFAVSGDLRYKNDYYGLAAVVQLKGKTGANSEYTVKTYTNEDSFAADKANYEEVLLVFRGSFDVEKRDANGNPAKLTAASVKSDDGKGNVKVQNTVTVNNCIDFENGTVTIEKNDNSITVDFDGDLFTSVKRSKIWSGKSTFTEIKNGTEFNLVRYNTEGELLKGEKTLPANQQGKPITLLWPCGLSLAQTISGMAFNMMFGAMGIVYDYDFNNAANKEMTFFAVDENTPVKGYVVSFSASLDLSFLVPGAKKAGDDGGWKKMQEQFSAIDQNGQEMRNRWNGLDFTGNYMNKDGDEEVEDEKVKGQASVIVHNILYGCNEGFMGFNFTVKLTLPPYSSSMPTLKGEFSLNTIGSWAAGFEGEGKFGSLQIEAALGLKSHNNIPVPDKLYFYIGGFEPGINIDGHGVVWITGGGGGFDNLYDTIFCASDVPPLKLMLSISFDILKVLQARADLTLSLRGISLKASDIGIKGIKELIVFKKIALTFEWYPKFYFMASANADILKIISGSGYIVIIQDDAYKAFFEFFLRAMVSVPECVPIVGGMTVGGVDLGANNSKIWGALTVIGIKLGVTYHWGGDVDFGTGSDVKPTFPDLLDYPVGYDEKTGETLYMRLGGNVGISSMAEIIEDGNFDASPRLFGIGDFIKSNGAKTSHRVELASYAGEARALTVSYMADDKTHAKTLASQISFDPPLSLIHYGDDPDSANANLSYDENTKTAMLSMAFTDGAAADFDVTTPVSADLIIYDIAAVPEINALGITGVAGGKIDINWSGSSNLGDLDYVSFYFTKNAGGEPGEEDYLLGALETGADIEAGTAQFELPGELKSGNYYLRAVYSQTDVVNGTIASAGNFAHVNANQPSNPSGVAMTNSGDLNFTVSAANSGGTDYDGYIISLYEDDGTPTDFAGVVFEKDENGALPVMRLGGSYQASGEDEEGNPVTKQIGLIAGKAYKAGIIAYKYVYENQGDGEPSYAVLSDEVFSPGVVLKAPTPPKVGFVNATGFKRIDSVETFAVSDVVFNVTSDVPVTGFWTLDGSGRGDIGAAPGNSAAISLFGLDDGEHTITVRGTDGEGDGFYISKTFAIDTKPPKLMLSSPTNGSFFGEDGKLVISGITDPGTKLYVAVSGNTIIDGAPVAAIDPISGEFGLTVSVNSSVTSHNVQISVRDEMDNYHEENLIVVNRGLGNIASLSVYMDNKAPKAGNHLEIGAQGASAQLSLAATTAKGNIFLLDNSLVEWSANAVEGNASVDANGILSVGAGSMGIVTGKFYVSPTLDGDSNLSAAMTAYATFGEAPAEDNNNDNNNGNNNVIISPPESETETAPAADDDTNEVGDAPVANVNEISAKAGELVFMNLPQGADENIFVAYYYAGGIKIYVKMSAVIDGKLYFVAPADAVYYFEENKIEFADTPGHWGKNYIDFAAARRLFIGVSTTEFAPEGTMTRGMFVTVLGRLADINEKDYTTSAFKDVEAGSWYAPFVTWAAENGVVLGYGDDNFGPEDFITREQMCAMIKRYLDFAPYSLPAAGNAPEFHDRSEISGWALEAVLYCRNAGLVQGRDTGKFDPRDNLTRAEACAVFERLIRAILEEFILAA